MGYDYSVKGYYRIKPECDGKVYKRRVGDEWDLYTDDILTKNKDGTYMKQTGLGMLGFIIPDEDLVYHEEEAHLIIM